LIGLAILHLVHNLAAFGFCRLVGVAVFDFLSGFSGGFLGFRPDGTSSAWLSANARELNKTSEMARMFFMKSVLKLNNGF
jgi:hypothetical protein